MLWPAFLIAFLLWFFLEIVHGGSRHKLYLKTTFVFTLTDHVADYWLQAFRDALRNGFWNSELSACLDGCEEFAEDQCIELLWEEAEEFFDDHKNWQVFERSTAAETKFYIRQAEDAESERLLLCFTN